jgi:PPK2 family polyphosphate:nucleotide phosphotransferase
MGCAGAIAKCRTPTERNDPVIRIRTMPCPKYVERYRIDRPEKFRLADVDPGDTCDLDLDKDDAKEILAKDIKRLAELQERLYAHDRWSLLVILQAMDTAGKDGVIKHVMSGLNPQGCEVHPFKAPSAQELDHDFLWRAARVLPERGRIGIFTRSHYEEVLVVRVHPEILARQKLPAELVTGRIWEQRFEAIRNFEHHLVRNGTIVLKFFLHISREEQRERFLARIDDPAKRWKFSMGDVAERKLWDRYMAAFQDAIRKTSTAEAPWFVVPANKKWFSRLVVSAAMIDALERLDLHFPKVEGAALEELKRAREALVAEEARGKKR